MSAEDEIAALRAEVAELRAWQASHACYSPPSPFYAQAFGNTMCASAAPLPQNYIVNTTGALPPSAFGVPGCAGGFAGQVFTVTVPA